MQFTFHPHAEYLAHQAEIDAAIRRVLDSGHHILGPEVSAFEKEFAAAIGTAHCVGVANGTDAVHIALRACGVGSGDVVATVSHTAVATVAAIELSGASPLLVDIEPDTFTLDPGKLDAALTANPGVKALVLVHIYGQPASLTSVEVARRHGLLVIEDCAQSHGATLEGRTTGTWADAAAFSFYPTKNLAAIGDGGAVLTNSETIAARARELRQYGWRQRYISDSTGINSRLDELQAAILRVKLGSLSASNQRRRDLAARYTAGLVGTSITAPVTRPGASHVFHQYVVRSPQRDELLAALNSRNIPAAIHYPQPVHSQPAYAGRVQHSDLSETERACREILSLPLHPHLSEEAVDFTINAVRELA